MRLFLERSFFLLIFTLLSSLPLLQASEHKQSPEEVNQEIDSIINEFLGPEYLEDNSQDRIIQQTEHAREEDPVNIFNPKLPTPSEPSRIREQSSEHPNVGGRCNNLNAKRSCQISALQLVNREGLSYEEALDQEGINAALIGAIFVVGESAPLPSANNLTQHIAKDLVTGTVLPRIISSTDDMMENVTEITKKVHAADNSSADKMAENLIGMARYHMQLYTASLNIYSDYRLRISYLVCRSTGLLGLGGNKWVSETEDFLIEGKRRAQPRANSDIAAEIIQYQNEPCSN